MACHSCKSTNDINITFGNNQVFSRMSYMVFFSFRIQNNGLGGLTANSVLMAWPENWKEKDTWKKFVCKKNFYKVFFSITPAESSS